MTSSIPLPTFLHTFFSKFPLHTYPPVPAPYLAKSPARPTLWIQPPHNSTSAPPNLLSADVECLKWQAYIALRGLTDIAVRWDVSPAGAIDARLPSLHTPGPAPQVLGARMIPGWADDALGRAEEAAFEGYRDESAKNESRAWVALLEGVVHAALVLHQPRPSAIAAFLWSPTEAGKSSLATILAHPPPPLLGLSSLLPSVGERIAPAAIHLQYRDAVISLSTRLGADQWFLGSPGPTALDALVFAYLHTLLDAPGVIQIEVNKRANLVAWEKRVREVVQSAFHPAHPSTSVS